MRLYQETDLRWQNKWCVEESVGRGQKKDQELTEGPCTRKEKQMFKQEHHGLYSGKFRLMLLLKDGGKGRVQVSS